MFYFATMDHTTKNKRAQKTSRFIRNARENLQCTQRELADRIGKQRSDIAKYETQGVIPPGDVVLDILVLFEHRIVDMFI